MRVILDTNIIVSAFLAPASTPSLTLEHLQQTATLLASHAAMEELTEVIFRKSLIDYFPVSDVLNFWPGIFNQ